MCTVTFIARQRGYCLGMNRDEKLTRPTGLPPKRKKVNGRAVISPSEPGGGTWIGVNDHGSTLVLINWYCITARVNGKAVSRGEVINSMSASGSPEVADTHFRELPLNRVNPFRLIGVFPVTGEIVEWRWNLKQLVRKNHRWKSQQWISSGFDEPTAQRVRGRTFQAGVAATFRRQPGLAASFTSLAFTASRPILNLYAPRRCHDGELRRSYGFIAPSHDAI